MTDQEAKMYLEINEIISEKLGIDEKEIPLSWTFDDIGKSYPIDSLDEEDIITQIERKLSPNIGFSEEFKMKIRYQMSISEIIDTIIAINK